MRKDIMQASASPDMFISGLVTNANSFVVTTGAPGEWLLVEIDPLIPGTRVPIYRVAALLDGGMSVKDVAEDFPSLSVEQIVAAREYAKDNPPSPGIRYPQQSIKRLLLNSGFLPKDEDEN